MAKKEKLSPEELLEQALVKEEEQPYAVPDNWVWCLLGNTTILRRGASPRPINNYITDNDDGINWIKIGDADSEKYLYKTNQKISSAGAKKSVYVERGSLILSNSMSFGRPYILACNGCIHDGWLAVTFYNELILKEYMYFALVSSRWYFERVAVGTAVRNLNIERVAGLPFALPPFPEQQRIVAVIESLFEKLDRAKELVKNTLESFENRKSAILHKAFAGELTRKWREDNGVDFNWKNKILKEIAIFKTGYAFDSAKFTDSGYQVIRMGNLYNGVLDLSRNPVYLNEREIEAGILNRSKVVTGDILLTLTGTKYKRDYGFAVLISDEIKALVNQRIVCLTAKNIEARYLWNYLRTDLFRNVFFSNETGGVNQGNVSSKFVETIIIPIPSIEEQQEIVRILDNLLANEQKAKELCDVIDKIDHMKKSILARAFRGELGTNNPDEESALELLKEVLKAKA